MKIRVDLVASLTHGSDHNPAEKRVCSPKSMANFKTLPGQEGDPYIAEFRALDHSKSKSSQKKSYLLLLTRLQYRRSGWKLTGTDNLRCLTSTKTA